MLLLSTAIPTTLRYAFRYHQVSFRQKRCLTFKRMLATKTIEWNEKGIKRFIDEIEPSELVAFEKVLKSRKCEIEQKLPCDYDVKEPNSVQLKLVFLNQLLPFIGFGFLDNFIMIVAGDYIDETFGITLGISTLAAAGLGNALSDVAALGSAWYVEQIANRMGIECPPLTPYQSSLASTKFVIHGGRIVGIVIGCLLGMLPLLFIDSSSRDKSETT